MLYTIGDIHGKLGMLKLLLSHIEARPDFDGERDRVIFLGDYIDRGEDSKGVINTVLAWKDKYPNTVCLRGNFYSTPPKKRVLLFTTILSGACPQDPDSISGFPMAANKPCKATAPGR